MKRHAQRFYSLIAPRIHSPQALLFLAGICLLEAILFVPVDPIVAFYAIERPSKIISITFVAALTSLFGGLIGYFFGDLLWDTIGQHIIKFFSIERGFERFVAAYKVHKHASVFFGALLPLPFKAITISAGFCQLPLIPFSVALFSARFIRFGLVSYASSHWSKEIKTIIDQSFNRLVALLLVKILVIGIGSYYLFY
jgi:membrane protein YqaA with SNARE-associated domain